MGKTKTREEATEGQAAVFADRLSAERDKTAFGTPTKAIKEILTEVKTFLDSGAYKKDQFFQKEWPLLNNELKKLFDQANSDQVIALQTKNAKTANSQQELLNLIVPCLDKLEEAGGSGPKPSTITAAREQSPQLGVMPSAPPVFTGRLGGRVETSLPDQFQQGLAESDQEPARQLLEGWYNAHVYGGDTKKAGKAFYSFLESHVNPKQLDTMLCGTNTGAQCSNIKQMFKNGDLAALLKGDYPISETLRAALEEASRKERFIISNMELTITPDLWVGDNWRLGAKVNGAIQTALTRTRTGTGPVSEKYEQLFEGSIGPAAALKLGTASELSASAGAGYGQLERGVFFPAELKLSSSLGTTEGTALFFDIYGRGKFGLDLDDFRQLQGGADAYLILFQIGEKQVGVFVSADVMNVKGKSQEFSFDVTNLQLNLGPQFQTDVKGWLIALQAGPIFVFPIQGAGGETTYGVQLGMMFQKDGFKGGFNFGLPNLSKSSVVTGNQEDNPLAFTGNVTLGFTFDLPGVGRR